MRKRRKTPSSTSVQTNSAHLSIGDVLFPEDWLNQKARELGFIKRKSRKIHPRNLLAALVEESLRGSPSYNDLASSIESNDATDPSRQAVAMRLGKDFEEFLKSILGHVISLKVDQDILAGKFDAANFRGYRRVLPETHLPLDLPALLKRRGSLDIEVLMNATRRGPGFGSWRPPSTRKPPTSGA